MLVVLATHDVMGMISNVGFPIAAFLLMYRMATKTIEENTRALQDLVTLMESQEK